MSIRTAGNFGRRPRKETFFQKGENKDHLPQLAGPSLCTTRKHEWTFARQDFPAISVDERMCGISLFLSLRTPRLKSKRKEAKRKRGSYAIPYVWYGVWANSDEDVDKDCPINNCRGRFNLILLSTLQYKMCNAYCTDVRRNNLLSLSLKRMFCAPTYSKLYYSGYLRYLRDTYKVLFCLFLRYKILARYTVLIRYCSD